MESRHPNQSDELPPMIYIKTNERKFASAIEEEAYYKLLRDTYFNEKGCNSFYTMLMKMKFPKDMDFSILPPQPKPEDIFFKKTLTKTAAKKKTPPKPKQ